MPSPSEMWNWLLNLSNALAVIALGLSLRQWRIAVGQVAAARHDAEMARNRHALQESRLNDQAAKLELLIGSLSTRYAKSFPHYLPAIADLVRRTKSELLVLSTLPLIGAVNSQREWIDLRHALDTCLKQRDGVKVSAIFANSSVRRAYFRLMFPAAAKNWSAWALQQENEEKISGFETLFPFVGRIRAAEDWFAALEAAADDVLDRDYVRAEVLEIDTSTMISLWISDRKEAILAIRAFAAKGDSHAFVTSDHDLVEALRLVHEEYHAQATPRTVAPRVTRRETA